MYGESSLCFLLSTNPQDDDQLQLVAKLISACSEGRVLAVAKLLRAGVDPSKSDYDQRQPLHLAATEGQSM